MRLKSALRAGKILAVTVKAGNPQLSHDTTIGKLPDDISGDQSSRWQALARIGEEEVLRRAQFLQAIELKLIEQRRLCCGGTRRRSSKGHVE